MSRNLKEIQFKLYEQLKPSGWGDKLKMFILSDDFLTILQELERQSTSNKKFTPTIKHLFRAFIECPYDKLKVVIINQDPYPKEGAADGIAFSCKNTEHPSHIQPNLKSIYKALDQDGIEHNHTYDLADWANQGILLLNTALTTQMGMTGVHQELWKPFMVYLFDVLSTDQGIVYALMGKVAQEWESFISLEYNFIYKCHHPSAAAYSEGVWESDGIFKKITETIKQMTNYDIKW